MYFLSVKGLLARNSNSLSLKNTFYWTIANLNLTQSKYCTMIIKIVNFQQNRMCGKFHIRIQFFVHSKSLLFVLIMMTGSSIAWSIIGWKIWGKLDFTRWVIVQLRFVCLIHSLHSCANFSFRLSRSVT